ACAVRMQCREQQTARLQTSVLSRQDFEKLRNIDAEVEIVIQALTSRSFSRSEFFKEIEPCYIAIERAAQTLNDWQDKQLFIDTVYERFFQGYSVKVADTHGIVYTPQEIVDFMCAAVEEVLHDEFGQALGDEDVYILDPATGTGNLIVNLIRRAPPAHLERMYKQQLFANEVMLL